MNIRYHFEELHGGVDILVATPGRLFDIIDRKRMTLSNVEVHKNILLSSKCTCDISFTPPSSRASCKNSGSCFWNAKRVLLRLKFYSEQAFLTYFE